MTILQEDEQFWKQRSAHTSDALFASPALLWEAACAYFQWCDQHPWQKTEQLKKPIVAEDGSITAYVLVPAQRPYTIMGLCLYLGASEQQWKDFRERAKNDAPMMAAIGRIEDTIYHQKFEGAAVGAFNAGIIARDLGLAEKTHTEIKGEKPDWFTSGIPRPGDAE